MIWDFLDAYSVIISVIMKDVDLVQEKFNAV